jgi:putative membrane protein
VANQGVGGITTLPDATRLAVDRTRLAYERTLMAWVRTATSLISFGFTIYKFFQAFREEQGAERVHHLIGSRGYGLLMISIGLVALLLATWQHRRDVEALRRQYGEVPYSLATVIAGLIAILGLLSLILVILRE